MTAAIDIQSVGKRYRLGSGGGVPRAGARARRESLWALRDVSACIAPGEVVGIIGRNGAGKSTLLKILSRITEPTAGRIEMRGRVGSLLEVGTGFHPELTGRENIYLNGALLGMKRAEIRRRFDEIVAFAEVDRFLETPVKRYSSGMYVRLAFAVAAHLEPEILLIDEVLAVGDLTFQAKCLGKMGDVAQSGRTVLFVSHNMGAIGRLCPRSLLIEGGRLVADGPTANVVTQYVETLFPVTAERQFPVDDSKSVQFISARLLDEGGRPASRLDQGRPFSVETEFIARAAHDRVHVAAALDRPDGTAICHTLSQDSDGVTLALEPGGRYVTRVRFPGGVFGFGRYVVRVGLANPVSPLDHQEVCTIELMDGGSFASTDPSGRQRAGAVIMNLPWYVASTPSSAALQCHSGDTRPNTGTIIKQKTVSAVTADVA